MDINGTWHRFRFLKKHTNYLDDLMNQENPVCWVFQTRALTKKSSDMRVLFDNSHESLIEKHENTVGTLNYISLPKIMAPLEVWIKPLVVKTCTIRECKSIQRFKKSIDKTLKSHCPFGRNSEVSLCSLFMALGEGKSNCFEGRKETFLRKKRIFITRE